MASALKPPHCFILFPQQAGLRPFPPQHKYPTNGVQTARTGQLPPALRRPTRQRSPRARPPTPLLPRLGGRRQPIRRRGDIFVAVATGAAGRTANRKAARGRHGAGRREDRLCLAVLQGGSGQKDPLETGERAAKRCGAAHGQRVPPLPPCIAVPVHPAPPC